jgi:hypothetical protein
LLAEILAMFLGFISWRMFTSCSIVLE